MFHVFKMLFGLSVFICTLLKINVTIEFAGSDLTVVSLSLLVFQG